MKITYDNISKKFCEVKFGELFQRLRGGVFLKIEPCFDHYGKNGEKYNAISILSGTPVNIEETEKVFPKPNTEVILKC